jgi:hypothetical protein
MKIEYKLDESHYLTYQLYIASVSESIIKKRKRNKILVPAFYLLFGILGLLSYQGPNLISAIFVIGGLLWYFYYPKWEKRRYIKHYKNFIKENYSNRFDKVITVQLEDDFLLATDDGSETKISTKEVEKVTELSTMLLLKLKNGTSILFPKDKIENIEKLIIKIKELANRLNIPYTTDFNWEWK